MYMTIVYWHRRIKSSPVPAVAQALPQHLQDWSCIVKEDLLSTIVNGIGWEYMYKQFMLNDLNDGVSWLKILIGAVIIAIAAIITAILYLTIEYMLLEDIAAATQVVQYAYEVVQATN